MTKLLEGLPVARAVREEAAAIADPLIAQGRPPTLCIIRATEDAAAQAYERSIVTLAEKLAFEVVLKTLAADSTQDDVLRAVGSANRNEDIDGILMLAPFPQGVEAAAVMNAIDPVKDVDGATSQSLAGVFMGLDIGFPPATPQAVMRILDFYEVPLEGRRAVVIGRSLVVGKPAAMLLLERDATVTLCHSRTADIAVEIADADIVVSAVGRARFLGADDFEDAEGPVVIDVGMNVDVDGSLCGDIDFEAVEPHVAAITPVPGGVGTVATSVLLWHCAIAAKHRRLK